MRRNFFNRMIYVYCKRRKTICQLSKMNAFTWTSMTSGRCRISPCKFLVIIPWIVVEELDRLKSRSSNSYENSSKTNQPDVATLAQRAISFLHDCLAEKHDGIRGQKINEKIEKPKVRSQLII